MPRYNPASIEPKWQAYWESRGTFRTPDLPTGPKLYVLDMFPYPSGDGLHVGHPEGYSATDILCRFERMRGKCVLHPMGFDAFGLPAEEHAIRTNTPPRVSTERNIATFRRQLKMLGFSYDWSRELATTDVGYFRWTQWIFLQIYDTWYDPDQRRGRPIAELPVPDEVCRQGPDAVARYRDDHRLAYQLEAPVNWCPALGTVLANEEVQGGVSERGGHPVVRIPLKQWMLRITAYADRLLEDLEPLDWSEGVKALQRNWIGRSTGCEVDFFLGSAEQAPGGRPLPAAFAAWKAARGGSGYPAQPAGDVLRVYTTRPDTLFGVTYMVIAPEHPLVSRLTQPDRQSAVAAYCEQAARKSDLDRTELAKDKSGVFTGSYAVNPVNGEAVPIWVADYVLISYGTGAIMAVPAHDERDHAFARAFGLDIRAVVEPPAGTAAAGLFTAAGTAVNSGPYSGLSTAEFKERVTADLAGQGLGRAAVNYKLRDWLFSRQRFWGEPFPILHELDAAGQPTGRLLPVPERELPVDLPVLDDYQPHGRPEPPLEKAPADWLYPVRDGVRYKRETNTMPQWAGSCWYYLRFIDPANAAAFVDRRKERAWMPVDLYVGGAEHAVLHLLYARFWHKVLYDRGHVSTPEPFHKLVNQGMILGEVEYTGYQRADGSWVSLADVRDESSQSPTEAGTAAPLARVKLREDQVVKKGDVFVLAGQEEVRVDSRAHKMSKSRGNVVNPDEVVREYGADSLRLYEMFMGPLEATKPWSMQGVSGVRSFLDRVWRLVIDERAETMALHPAVRDVPPGEDLLRPLHKTIRAVTEGLETMAFNTAISRMMELTNLLTPAAVRPKPVLEALVLLLSPYAPHLCEELWQALGHGESLAHHPWPQWDEALTRDARIEVPVQIKGKLRGKITVPADASEADLESAARADEKIAALLAGQQVVKVIVVRGRLVNFVTR